MTGGEEASPRGGRGIARFSRRVLIVVVVGVVLATLWLLRDVVLLGFAASLVAIALHLGAVRVCRLVPLPHGVAVVGLFIAALVLVAILGLLFGNQVAEQAGALRERLPAIQDSLTRLLARVGMPAFDPRDLIAPLRSSSGQIAQGATTLVSGGVTALGGLLLLIFLGLFLALDPSTYRDGLLRLAPPKRRPRLRTVSDELARGLARWLGYQALSSALIGLITGLGLWALGVPLAGLLGLITGVLGFIPVIGSVLGAALSVLVALTVGPLTALWTLLFTIAVQQLEGNVLVPLVQKEGIDLPPAATLIGVLAFGTLLGPAGAVLALPLTMLVRVVVLRLYVEDVLEREKGSAGDRTQPPREAV